MHAGKGKNILSGTELVQRKVNILVTVTEDLGCNRYRLESKKTRNRYLSSLESLAGAEENA